MEQVPSTPYLQETTGQFLWSGVKQNPTIVLLALLIITGVVLPILADHHIGVLRDHGVKFLGCNFEVWHLVALPLYLSEIALLIYQIQRLGQSILSVENVDLPPPPKTLLWAPNSKNSLAFSLMVCQKMQKQGASLPETELQQLNLDGARADLLGPIKKRWAKLRGKLEAIAKLRRESENNAKLEAKRYQEYVRAYEKAAKLQREQQDLSQALKSLLDLPENAQTKRTLVEVKVIDNSCKILVKKKSEVPSLVKDHGSSSQWASITAVTKDSINKVLDNIRDQVLCDDEERRGKLKNALLGLIELLHHKALKQRLIQLNLINDKCQILVKNIDDVPANADDERLKGLIVIGIDPKTANDALNNVHQQINCIEDSLPFRSLLLRMDKECPKVANEVKAIIKARNDAFEEAQKAGADPLANEKFEREQAKIDKMLQGHYKVQEARDKVEKEVNKITATFAEEDWTFLDQIRAILLKEARGQRTILEREARAAPEGSYELHRRTTQLGKFFSSMDRQHNQTFTNMESDEKEEALASESDALKIDKHIASLEKELKESKKIKAALEVGCEKKKGKETELQLIKFKIALLEKNVHDVTIPIVDFDRYINSFEKNVTIPPELLLQFALKEDVKIQLIKKLDPRDFIKDFLYGSPEQQLFQRFLNGYGEPLHWIESKQIWIDREGFVIDGMTTLNENGRVTYVIAYNGDQYYPLSYERKGQILAHLQYLKEKIVPPPVLQPKSKEPSESESPQTSKEPSDSEETQDEPSRSGQKTPPSPPPVQGIPSPPTPQPHYQYIDRDVNGIPYSASSNYSATREARGS